jgi:hypothetical protein
LELEKFILQQDSKTNENSKLLAEPRTMRKMSTASSTERKSKELLGELQKSNSKIEDLEKVFVIYTDYQRIL